MRAALAALVLLAGCTTDTSARRVVDSRAELELWAQEQAARHEEATEHVTRAPVVTVSAGTLIIPPGSTIETPAGKVTTPAAGPAARLDFREREKAGPVQETRGSEADTNVTRAGGEQLHADQHVEAQAERKVDIGFSWPIKLAIAGAVLLALLAALVVIALEFKESLPGRLLRRVTGA